MKNLVRPVIAIIGMLLLACNLHAQTAPVENDSIQPKAVFIPEKYCEADSTSFIPQDTTSDKSWKLRIDLKNWIIQIRKDQ